MAGFAPLSPHNRIFDGPARFEKPAWTEEKPSWTPLGCRQLENLCPAAEDETLVQAMNGWDGEDLSPLKISNWLSVKSLGLDWDDETEETEETEPGSPGFESCFAALLCDLDAATLPQTLAVAAARVGSAEDLADLADALYCKAVSEPVVQPPVCADLLACLLPRLPAFVAHRRDSHAGSAPLDLLSAIVNRCNMDLEGIETESPSANSHGNVLLLAELAKRNLVGLGAVKALFQKLVFGEQILDHAASLACHLFLAVGPVLDTTLVGRKLLDLVQMRLKELKGGNYSQPTRFSLGHVTDLRANRWQAKAEEKPAPKAAPTPLPKVCVSPAPGCVERGAYARDVLRIGGLFVQQRVQMPVVKALFQKLLFVPSVADADVELASTLLEAVGPVLDRSEVGSTLADYVLLRFQELKENCCAPTRGAVAEVTKLRAGGWSTERSFSFKVNSPTA